LSKPITAPLARAWAWLRMLAAALLLGGVAAPALAAITVTAVTINGGATTSTTPGANMTVNVTVVLTNGSKWRATSFTTTPTSDLSWCYFSPNISGNGTYTRSFTVSAPSTVGTFTLNTRGYTGSQCGGTASATRTNPSGIVTGSPPAALNHVRIVHDGSALTCGIEPVTIRACANTACTTLYTGNVTVALGAAAGSWSSNPFTFSGGNGTVNLSNGSAGTVSLSGTVSSPAATSTAAVCYKGSTAGDCAMVFANAACGLDAVETGKSPNTAIYTKRSTSTVTLDVLALNNGVINTGSTATIAATLVSGTSGGCTTTALSPTVTFTLTGANAGRRAVTFSPNTAARDVRVRMVSGSLVGCSSDNFAIRPTSLTLTATGVGADATGASVSATPVLKADTTTFSLAAASSTGYNGVPIINQNLIESSGAMAGTVSGTFTGDSSGTWTATGNAFKYSEVGYFRFAPYGVYDDTFADIDEAKNPRECFTDVNLGTDVPVADPNVVNASGMVGCYFGSAQTAYFGRFIPDHFVLDDNTITNRSAIPACTASTFSYLGETLTPVFTLSAVNGSGVTTENYMGGFARLNLATQLGLGAINNPAVGARTPFPVCGGVPAHPCITPAPVVGAFDDGSAIDVEAPLTVLRGSAAVAPFTTFQVGIAPVDLDGVKLGTYDLDTVNVVAGANNHGLVGSTILRYGRMGIDNAYGSELLNLTMRVSAQYWNGLGYATNTLDSCTPLVFAPFVAADYKVPGGITAVNMPDARKVPGPAMASGVSQLVLQKPGPATPSTKGSVTVRSAHSWLPGSGRATFGVYKSGPVIHVRETY
jgi:hypothetical protein